jgi:hypothetical protein
MKNCELLDYNISRFVSKTGSMPSSIILNPRFVNSLIDEYKEHIQFVNTIDIHRLPIKYRGIRVYESSQLNEGQIELTLELL